MKNNRMELFARMQKANTKKSFAWHNNIFIPHVYNWRTEDKKENMTGWDDVGFILNGKKYFVNFVHPRLAYYDKIESVAFDMVDEPDDGFTFGKTTKVYKKAGNSRKVVVAYRHDSIHDEFAKRAEYYSAIDQASLDMMIRGIDITVVPSIKARRLVNGVSVELIAPIEVCSKENAINLAQFAKRLIKGETTLEKEFPGYAYTKDSWLQDTNFRDSEINLAKLRTVVEA